MQTYTLHELNTYIRQVVALNFEDPVWITCEISQVRESRGQMYLELIQQNEEQSDIVAMCQAVVWYKNHLFIKKKLGDLYHSILADGTEVSIKVQVTYHERYGLKLNIVDIDPSYTIGQQEMQRQQIVERLRKAGVLEDNKMVSLPRVIQRVAVISSEQAAGYKDFIHQIEHNAYGYAYQCDLLQVAVQGVKVEEQVCAALQMINDEADKYDVIVIIRGGGSRLDLAGFDNYNIGYKIATSLLPVLTGIGHEIDTSVADVVAHTPLKTPTAVADFLIEHNMAFDSELSQLSVGLQQSARRMLQVYSSDLAQASKELAYSSQRLLLGYETRVDAEWQTISYTSSSITKSLSTQLDHMQQLMTLADPKAVLKRGYAIIRQGDKVISKVSDVDPNHDIDVELSDGHLTR